MIINFDLKQIEIVGFAQLSQDPHLIDLLNNGADIHYYTGEKVLNKPKSEITEDERNDIKKVNFGLIYGNGAKTASINTGRPEAWCKTFIDGFFTEFPRTKEWHSELIAEVNKTGRIQMFSGINLRFKQYPAKFDWQDKNKLYYNPAEIKNYPVQHTAFVIFSTFLAEFYRKKAIHNRDKYLLINTVHDSLMLDCRPEFVQTAIEDLKETLDKLPKIVYTKYDYEFVVPIKADIKTANSWYEL